MTAGETRHGDPERFGATAADPVFVWAVWAAMLAAALWLVATCGRNHPRGDDKFVLPYLTGQGPEVVDGPWQPTAAERPYAPVPVTLEWLWVEHNEHRMPLPKLLMVALYRLTRDFRSGMVYNVVALAAGSAALIVAARRARGWTAYADALFPLMLLHWGHADNLLWFFQLQFVTGTLLAVCALALIAGAGAQPGAAAALALGVCLTGLVLCGANGLALAPVPALWLLCYGLLCPRRRAAALVGGALPLAVGALYSVGYRGPQDEMVPGLVPVLRTSVDFLADCWGLHLVQTYAAWWAAAALAVLALGVAVAATGWLGQPADRWRAAGVLSFFAGLTALALAIGVGRARYGEIAALLSFRYVTLAAPLPCATYLAVVLYQRGRLGHWLSVGLMLAALGTAALNARLGLFYAGAINRPPSPMSWSQGPAAAAALPTS